MKQFYGVIPSKRDIRDYRLNKKIAKIIELPDSFGVGVTRIKNQGQVGSCVAHSLSSIVEHTDHIMYSTDWIYGYRPFGYYQGDGMMPSQALKTVTQLGAVRYIDLPSNTEMPEAKKIVTDRLQELKDLAANKQALKYARLHTVQQIKEAIYTSKSPVLICINIGTNGLRLNNGVAEIPKATDGGHALMCYGWDERGLLIQNSWGRAWGKNGCFVLPYDYPFTEAWAISFSNDNVIVKPTFYDFRDFLVKLARVLAAFFKGLFQSKEKTK